MFGVADITTVAIIEHKLRELSRNPEHLAFILCGYSRDPLLVDYIGSEYIKDAMDFVMNNKITVIPYYSLDLQQLPNISVVASGHEDQQYVGDYGYTTKLCPLKPSTLTSWDADSYESNIIHLSPEYKIHKKIWVGAYVNNGTFTSKIEGILESGSIYVKDDVPSTLPLKGWKAQTGGSDKNYIVSSSTDKIEINCQLTSNGDPSVHRLLSVVLRYILKSSRLTFDRMGIQNAHISYSPIMVQEQESIIFQSTYNISGDYTDSWIDREDISLDTGMNTCINLVAVTDNPVMTDVDLEDL